MTITPQLPHRYLHFLNTAKPLTAKLQVLQQARISDVPKDIIERNIKKASDKSQADFTEVRFGCCTVWNIHFHKEQPVITFFHVHKLESWTKEIHSLMDDLLHDARKDCCQWAPGTFLSLFMILVLCRSPTRRMDRGVQDMCLSA